MAARDTLSLAAAPAPVTATLVGAALLLLSAAGLWVDPATLFAAWLAAWWFCAGVVLGAMVNLHIHALTGGAWGETLAPAALALRARAVWLLPLFLPVVLGARQLYPWAGAAHAPAFAMAQPAFAEFWFAPLFAALRLGLYAIAGAWCLSRSDARRKGRAALRLLVFCFGGSLAATDFLMSLLPGWTSTAFPAIVLVSQMASGAAACVLLAARAALAGLAPPRAARGAPPVWRDLGNLLLMYVMLGAYLHYMQFLIVWAENLPREIAWFLPRVQGPWQAVSLTLIATLFVLPFGLLLWRRVKDAPRTLARVALLFLVAQALCAIWTVLPSVDARSVHALWLAPLVMAGMGLLLFGPAAGQTLRHEGGAP